MQERLERLSGAMQQRDSDVNSLLTTLLLPPVVELPEVIAHSSLRFVAFVSA